jgi:hypothetical protein
VSLRGAVKVEDSGRPAPSRRPARNDGAAARRSPVTFCDRRRTDFAAASGQIQLAAGILAAVQVIFASLRALMPGPQFRAGSGRNREGDGR